MKKRIIALSVAAALGGVAGSTTALAQADYLAFNPDGVGHILIIPYFNTQSGNATAFSIVNTDIVHGKAVKVRFRGASNSDDIFDFQLFLSPGDVWSATVSQNTDSGLSQLTTFDKSCTLPSNVNQEFITTRLNTEDLSGDALANETREGYVEILNMGDIPSVSGTTSVWYATKHNTAGVPPCNTSASARAILENLTVTDTELDAPTTGLMANWTVINVPNTTTWAGEAAAIEARLASTARASYGRNVFWPQRADGVLENGYPLAQLTADALFQAGIGDIDGLQAAYYDLPDLSTPYLPGVTPPCPFCQANDLSDSLATTGVATEYLSNPGIQASTDWVVSKPTRRYYVGVDYAASTAAGKLVTNYDDNSIPIAHYYRSKLSDGGPTGNTVMGTGPSGNGGKTYQACTQVDSVTFFNREEGKPDPGGIVISPGTIAPAPSLCGEVSVLGINSPTSPVGASVSRFNVTLPSGFVDGWGLLRVANNFGAIGALGLPMLVSQFSKAVNDSAAPGTSGTYGANWTGRVVEGGRGACTPLPGQPADC